MTTSPDMSGRTGMRLGPYQLNGLLGKGGMGEVYLAQDTRLGRKAAVKLLPRDSTRNVEQVRRFEQEAIAASALNHPNILTIYDSGVVEGTYYIATEYVEGQTLRGLINGKAIALTRALEIAAQCADGLAAAHAAGIIHRDIKPANIMVRPDGYVKILDFGLAKLAESAAGPTAAEPTMTALTAVGQIMGTCQYMSPEQSRGQELDARTDIWSLGAVLYEMVSGSSPFSGPTMSDTMAAVLTRDPLPLSSPGDSTGEALDRILSKALAKDQRNRYQSMADMAVDLRHLRQQLEAGKPSTSRFPAARLAFLGVAGLVVAALLIWGLLGRRPRVSALPERRLSYGLLVQKMREGKPYQPPFRATGREIFENGWKVQFDFSLPQAGSLYLLNDGPGSDGKQALSLVFPTPSVNLGSAQVTANERVQSAWLLLDDHAGREKFWLVWAVHPVPELQDALAQMFAAIHAGQDNPQIIRDPQLAQALPALLEKAPVASATADPANQQTSLQGQGDMVVSKLELEHE